MRNSATFLLCSALLAMNTAQAKEPAACPAGTFTVQQCMSTPKKGDHIVASEMLDAISVCVKGKNVSLAMRSGDKNQLAPAEVTPRAGGVTYTLREGENKMLDFSIALGSRIANTHASLSVYLNGEPLTATYTCTRTR